MRSHRPNKNLKAFSLLEVLIMLVVVSMVMVSAMSLIARTTISIKDNEILDVVNNIMFKSIELLKSPAPVNLSVDGYTKVTTSSGNYYFSMIEEGSLRYLKYNSDANGDKIGTCDPTNFYYYKIKVNDTQHEYNICLQLKIKRLRNVETRKFYYTIVANVVYELNGKIIKDSLTTYRYDTFAAK